MSARWTRRPSTRWTLGIGVVTLALAGGALAVVGVAPIVRHYLSPFGTYHPPPPELVTAHLAGVAISTVLLLGTALTLSVRATRNVAGKTLGWCLLFGWLNAAGSVGVGYALRGQLGAVMSEMCLGLLLGFCFAAPFGLIYGLVASAATTELTRLVQRPSLALDLHAQRVVGTVVTGAAGFALLVRMSGYGEPAPAWLPAAVGAVGLLLFVQALVRGRRITALERHPEAHGFERVPLAELGLERAALWPLHPNVSEQAAYALVKRAEVTGDGCYRAASARVPFALVD